MTKDNVKKYPVQCTAQDFVKHNRDRIISDAEGGSGCANTVIWMHQMLVQFKNMPTWRLFENALLQYQAESGLGNRDIEVVLAEAT